MSYHAILEKKGRHSLLTVDTYLRSSYCDKTKQSGKKQNTMHTANRKQGSRQHPAWFGNTSIHRYAIVTWSVAFSALPSPSYPQVHTKEKWETGKKHRKEEGKTKGKGRGKTGGAAARQRQHQVCREKRLEEGKGTPTSFMPG